MLRETGRVVAVESDAVWVETIPSSLCGRCGARAGCGQGVVSRATGVRGLVRALESVDVAASECQLNDEVEIELPESAILKGSAWVYGMPLVLGLLLSLSLEGAGELATVAGFGAGLGAGFMGVRLMHRHWASRRELEPLLAARRRPEAVIVRS